MKPLPPIDECVNRLHSRINIHHDAARFLIKTHKKPTHCQIFVAAALNRSISLVHGFCTLIPDNYISAASLVRLQLDSAVRFTALWLVEDREEFAKNVSSGQQINRVKDRDGCLMKDDYLVKRLNTRYPGVKQCYEDGCGYVHFSDTHFFHVQGRTDDGKFRLQIGGDLGISEDSRKDATSMMDQATWLLLLFVETYLQERDPSIAFLPTRDYRSRIILPARAGET
jgi:hypothetical protein